MKRFNYLVSIKGMTLADEVPEMKAMYDNTIIASMNRSVASIGEETPVLIRDSAKPMTIQEFIETFHPEYHGDQSVDDSFRYGILIERPLEAGYGYFHELSSEMVNSSKFNNENLDIEDVVNRAKELRDLADLKVLTKAVETFLLKAKL